MKMNFVLPFVCSLFTLLIFTTDSSAQPCDDCSHPRIAVYDAEVFVPRPESADSIIQWWALQWPMSVARSYISSNDLSFGCISWQDGAMINSRELHGDTLRFGHDFFNLPPAGEVSNSDYLLTGTITGSDGLFTFTLQLETAVSREIVMTKKATFGYDVTSQQAAGESAASAMMSLFQTIRNWEVNKRNTDVTVAIRDLLKRNSTPEITVTPRKTKLSSGVSTDIDIEMIDCDGVPLVNREIVFDGVTFGGSPLAGTIGGTIDPPIVTTDGSGKAVVKFTSTTNQGVGIINAWYLHKKPCGRNGVLGGQGTVNVAPNTYVVTLRSGFDQEYTNNMKSTFLQHLYQQNISENVTARFVYEVRDSTQNPDSLLEISYPARQGDTAYALSITGGSNDFEIEDRKEYDLNGSLDAIIHWETFTKGKTKADPVGNEIWFRYSSDKTKLGFGFYISCPINGHGQSRGYTKGVGWSSDSWQIDDSTATLGREFVPPVVQFQKNGSYHLWGDTTIVDTIGQVNQRRRWGDITVTSIAKPTGVVINHVKELSNFVLQEPFPNPFNPTTTIGYQVPQFSLVRLKIYDVLGQEVASLVDDVKQAGKFVVQWNASNFSSGVYFCHMLAGTFTESKKLILIK